MEERILREIMEGWILRRSWKTGYCRDNGRLDFAEIMEDMFFGDNGSQDFAELMEDRLLQR